MDRPKVTSYPGMSRGSQGTCLHMKGTRNLSFTPHKMVLGRRVVFPSYHSFPFEILGHRFERGKESGPMVRMLAEAESTASLLQLEGEGLLLKTKQGCLASVYLLGTWGPPLAPLKENHVKIRKREGWDQIQDNSPGFLKLANTNPCR